MQSVSDQFRDAMRSRSILAPEYLQADGRLHRCDVDGDRCGTMMADQVGACIDGQRDASKVIARLQTVCPGGDELYSAVMSIVGAIEPIAAARLRGFARSLQKRLEREATA